MPIYAYKCKACGERFEAMRRMSDRDEDVNCPACGKEYPQRVLSNVFASSGSGSGGGSAPVFRPT
jgi:putative FmdB family regulatory protein